MLVGAQAMSTFPGIVSGLRDIQCKGNLFLGYTLILASLQKSRREIIMGITGHETEEVFRIYIEKDPEELRKHQIESFFKFFDKDNNSMT